MIGSVTSAEKKLESQQKRLEILRIGLINVRIINQ